MSSESGMRAEFLGLAIVSAAMLALYGILIKTGAYDAIKEANIRLENQFRIHQG
jgi:hypothetical protein